MISEHSAHLTPVSYRGLSVDFPTWLWRYTYLLLLISMLWDRQAIFKSKGDKLCSSAECRIWTRGPRHQIANFWMLWQTDWAIEDQAKNLNSTARPYERHSAHLTPLSVDFRTWLWRYTYLLLLISMLSSCVPLQNAGFEPGVPDTKSPADWRLADQPTELSRIKLKTWTRQPVPMISEHSAHLTPLSVDFRTWLRWYTYLLLLISMLWHRQAIFKSKGDKLCSSAVCRIWTRGPRHQIASRLNARWQTDWAIEDQAKNLNSTARPYDQRAFSPLDPTVSWLSHLALAIYIFVVVNFDALAQASDIQIERRQVVFLCRMQDLNPGSQTPNRQQTECSLTNRLSYRGSSWKLELDSPSLWSASIQPTWPHCQLTFAPGSGDIHFVVVNFDALAQASDIQIERRQVVFLCRMQDLNPGSQMLWHTKSPADWMLADKPTELSRIKLKTWTRQPVRMISEHSAHLTPLSVDFPPGSGDIHICCC